MRTRWALVGFLWAAAAMAEPMVEVTEYGAVAALPDKYRNKAVSFKAPFIAYVPAMPAQLAAHGISQQRYLVMQVGDTRLPVVCKRTDSFAPILNGLVANTKLHIQGRVRQVNPSARKPGLPDYFLEITGLGIVEEKKVEPKPAAKPASPTAAPPITLPPPKAPPARDWN